MLLYNQQEKVDNGIILRIGIPFTTTTTWLWCPRVSVLEKLDPHGGHSPPTAETHSLAYGSFRAFQRVALGFQPSRGVIEQNPLFSDSSFFEFKSDANSFC